MIDFVVWILDESVNVNSIVSGVWTEEILVTNGQLLAGWPSLSWYE